jgi:hypothetical protein
MAAGATYESIATTTLSGNQTTITFSSISSGYTDLKLVVVPLSTVTGMNYQFQLNGDTASNYSYTQFRGNGSTVVSSRLTSTFFDNLNQGVSSTTPQIYKYDLMNYSNTTNNKTILMRFDENTGFVAASVGLWRSNSAITNITLTAVTNQFASGSTFSLYGIKAA